MQVLKYQAAATLVIKPNKRPENVQSTAPEPSAEPSASMGSNVKRMTTVECKASASQVDISIASEIQEDQCDKDKEVAYKQEEAPKKSPGFWEMLTDLLFRQVTLLSLLAKVSLSSSIYMEILSQTS